MKALNVSPDTRQMSWSRIGHLSTIRTSIVAAILFAGGTEVASARTHAHAWSEQFDMSSREILLIIAGTIGACALARHTRK